MAINLSPGRAMKTLDEQIKQLPESVLSHIKNLERMRRDFVANVSHELRTPLTVIRGYLESLRDQTDASHPWHKIFKQMYDHSLRMEQLITDLLLLSRIENVDGEHDDQVISITQMLEDICQHARDVSGNDNHQIELHTDSKLQLLGEESELKSLFSNLIINAVRYTPANGCINVEWLLKDDLAIFRVTDNGIGIEAEHIPRLTERFYRVDKARSRDSGGTGLGLAIVKHVVMRHDGDLLIDSHIGKGSTFTCVFAKHRAIIN